ncbi:MAG: hypothetical protein K2P76_15875 [Lachnospiraceae bacterium]|nr:hypothetical protein [Lachnospiraceae bacterium]MDE6982311.1 hypothetical protein [Lachnospiraceae bacterium]
MMSKVLIIEDDEILNAGLCYNLQKREKTNNLIKYYGAEPVLVKTLDLDDKLQRKPNKFRPS